MTGINTYTGGTAINGGTLAVSANANLGAPAGSLSFDGGTLRYLASFDMARATILNAGGSTFDTNGFSSVLSGAIGGTGGLTKTGAGTLTLNGTNTYSGGTTIAAGVLALGNGGTTGSIVGNVTNNGVLVVNRSDSLTLGGVISGTGSFTQFGTGTTIFTGANTYSGGTTISAGTLQLGNGGTGGSIVGNVADNAILAFNRSDAVTFGGVISGTGGVQQIGPGVTTLTAASTYTGPTNINAGTLSVDGSLASTVFVNAGGTLMGNGAIGGLNVASGGIVAPGHSIGQINVNGTVMFGAGSIYQVEVNPAGQSDKIVATGAATLSGGTVQVLAAAGNYGPGVNYSILSASSITGQFSGVTSNMAFLTASLAYTPTDVTLTLTRNATFFAGVAQTFNQRAVGGALDASPFGSALVQAVLPLSAPQALQAFEQLSGEVHPSTAGVLVDESRYVRDAVLGRLRQASYGGDASIAALSLGGPQVAALQNVEADGALAYARSPMVTKAPPLTPEPRRDIAFWAQGFGAWGKFDSDGNAASVNRDLAGFISGFDARFGNWRGGFAAGYTGSQNNTDGRGSANVETGHVAAYGAVSVGQWNVRAGGAYAFHSIDTDRSIVFPGFFDRATAHYEGGTGQIFGEASYGFAVGAIAVEPFAGGAWVHLSTDPFNERGGAAALMAAATTFEVGYSTLGIRAASMIPLAGGMILVPRASVAWQHAFDDVTPSATLAFQSTGAAFVVAGVPIARDSLLIDTGLDLQINRNATFGVSYVGQLASNVADHAVKGKFVWRF